MKRFDLGGYGKGGERITVNLAPDCDIQADILDIERYAPESASVHEFYLSHTLEHIPIERYRSFILGLRWRLVPNGRIVVVQSDIGAALELFNEGKLSFRAMRTILFPPTDRILRNPYNRHHQMWNAEELRRDFAAMGLISDTYDAGTWSFDTTDELFPGELDSMHGVRVPNLGVVGIKRTIPKIIHQTWKTEDIPEDTFRKDWQDTWKELPGFEYRFWTDEDNRALIEEHYPWFLEQYDAYDVPIKRADAARYFILHKYGGIYADLDLACLRPLDELLKGADHLLALQRPDSIANAFMAMAAEHPLMESAIKELSAHANRPVLEATGPQFLSNLVAKSPFYEELLRTELIYPFRWNDPKIESYRNMSLDELRQAFPQAVTATHWAASWKEKPRQKPPSRTTYRKIKPPPTFLLSLEAKRAKKAEERARQAGLEEIIWFKGFRDAGLSNSLPKSRGNGGLPGEIGCFLSHVAIAKTAWSMGLEHFLVLEDDIVFCRDFATRYAEVLDHFPECDALLLGYNLEGRISPEAAGRLDQDGRYLDPAVSLWGTHAILATASYAKALAATDLQIERAFDNQLYQMHSDGRVNLRVCARSICGQDRVGLQSHIAAQSPAVVPHGFDCADESNSS